MPESQQPIVGQKLMIDRILSGPHQRVLDVGAGDGKWGKLLKGLVPHLLALEVWPGYIKKYHLNDIYDVVIHGDLVKFDRFSEFDVIILGDVLEHLKRTDAIAVIDRLRQSGTRVFLTIPISKCVQDGTVYGNPYETHLDQWSHEELEAISWKVLHRGMNEAGTVEIGTYQLGKYHEPV